MSAITFTDNSTVIPASWLNDVNTVVYTYFGNGSSLNSPTALAVTKGTFSTSVVTPLVASASGEVVIAPAGASRWRFDNTLGILYPTADNAQSIGLASNRISALFTSIIDSGSAGSVSLKTNNGLTQVLVNNAAGAPDRPINLNAGQSGVLNATISVGNGIGLAYSTGDGTHQFYSDASSLLQFEIIRTAGITRHITVTGSNGGNPTIGVTGGSLAITPGVVIGGGIVAAGGLQLGTNPSNFGNGSVNLPYTGIYGTRNSTNLGDLTVALTETRNSITNIVRIGDSSGNGTIIRGRSGGAAPTTSDLLSGDFTVWRDTGGATTKLYYNNGGTIQSVALA